MSYFAGGFILKFKRHKLTYTQIIAGSFLLVIFAGALLLCLPVSSSVHEWTPFLDSFFTATSATCVTGLVVVDTYMHWSFFGQLVILALIQIGGLGFMTVMTMFTIFMHKRISLHKRRLLMQSAGYLQLNGVTTLIRKIIRGTILFEGAGTLLLATRFCPKMGFWEGLWNALFHSVSAFCNAGFDLMGKYGEFSSLTTFQSDIVVQLTVMGLIVIGGIGFFVWADLVKCKLHFKRYALHTKIVLTTTLFLILSGWIGFYLLEQEGALAGLNEGEKLLGALFQSVTTRTAGFNTIDQAALTDGGGILSIVLMLIGGSPGSTAGGIKTATIFIVLLNVVASVRNKDSITVFKKRISDDTVKQACSITTIYIILALVSAVAIMALESIELECALFETSSAIGTVGLTMGITPSIGAASKIILAFLMYAGRVGGLSLALAFSTERVDPDIQRPTEKVLVG